MFEQKIKQKSLEERICLKGFNDHQIDSYFVKSHQYKPSLIILLHEYKQKPIDLLVRIVLASTEKGDIVLDPFTGSSTTGLAAFLNGRKFIGIDMEKKYLDLSIKRLDELISKK